jgi:hypothetical protein
MKYLRKFNESSSIEENSIEDWCKKFKLTHYTIRKDNTVDVGNAHVDIEGLDLQVIPIQFGILDNDFNCSDNELVSLKGSPKKCRGFYCQFNILTTLEGCPQEVTDIFRCEKNKLTTLEDNTSMDCYDFICRDNQLESLKGSPSVIRNDFDCSSNLLETLEGSPKKVMYNFICNYNNISTIKGGPDEIGKHFYCNDNPLSELLALFEWSYKNLKTSIEDYNYIRDDDKIVKRRLESALIDIGINKELPKAMPWYKYI